jgi:hypothetical protein
MGRVDVCLLKYVFFSISWRSFVNIMPFETSLSSYFPIIHYGISSTNVIVIHMRWERH